MEIKIDFSTKNLGNLCPYCFGTGKLKAMRMAVNSKGNTVRYYDKMVKCSKCNGRGFIK